MRFYSGARNDDKKGKPSAAKMYRDRLAAKNGDKPAPGKDEMYKKLIEDRMAKMMEDYLLGKKKNQNALPGTKQGGDDKPKELSKSALTVIRMLAVRREAKERKVQKKKELAFTRAKNAKLYEEKRLKTLEEWDQAKKQAQLLADQGAKSNSSHFWGNDDDNKNSWW